MPRRAKKKFYFIYKTTNLMTGKFYIGMHTTDNLNDGYLGSGKILRYSINKYGIENHKIERLEFFENNEDLAQRESEIINESLLKDPLCMNLIFGGFGSWKFINSNIEMQKRKGKKANEKIRWLIKNDPEWVEKRFKNMSEAQKESYIKGRKIILPPSQKGKIHKKESKIKIGLANSIKQKGKNNSQYGTIWITNGNKNIKINKNNVIPIGFYPGRKLKKGK